MPIHSLHAYLSLVRLIIVSQETSRAIWFAQRLEKNLCRPHYLFSFHFSSFSFDSALIIYLNSCLDTFIKFFPTSHPHPFIIIFLFVNTTLWISPSPFILHCSLVAPTLLVRRPSRYLTIWTYAWAPSVLINFYLWTRHFHSIPTFSHTLTAS